MNNEQLNFEQPQPPQGIANDQADSLEMLLHRMINRIRQSLELSVILSGATAEVRSFLKTDRVKVYQFKPDGSGEVVAESISEADRNLPSLLGQHFPAEDIPPEIRELYLKERHRTIVNVAAQQIGISALTDEREREYIQFRTVDPCHAEYLTAMGVQSSLVVPIMDEDNLWGLLVSHHHCPRIVTARELEVVQLVADQTSIAIAQSNLLESARVQAKQEASINLVAQSLHSMTPMQLQQALQQTVLALQGSGGRVYIAPPNSDSEAQLYVSGEQPVLLPRRKKASIPWEEHPNWHTWIKNAIQTDSVIQPWAIGYASPKSIAELAANLLPSQLERAFKPTNIKSILTIRLEHRQKN
jgi:light-regulated signal transduction histidine kinase (bacteriophytochrome)